MMMSSCYDTSCYDFSCYDLSYRTSSYQTRSSHKGSCDVYLWQVAPLVVLRDCGASREIEPAVSASLAGVAEILCDLLTDTAEGRAIYVAVCV